MSATGQEPSSRWRPRVSLLTGFLMMTIVAMAIGLVRLGWEVEPLRREVVRLRRETGNLTIDDAKKLYVIGIETADRHFWRWRVYVPSGPRFYLHEQPFDVPKTGTPTERVPRAGIPIAPGEHLLEFRLKPVESEEGRKDQLVGHLRGRDDANYMAQDIVVRERKADWINTPYSSEPIVRGDGVWLLQRESDPDEPLVLLRLRAGAVEITSRNAAGEPTGWGYAEIDEPTDGIMIWIDQFEDNAGAAAANSGSAAAAN